MTDQAILAAFWTHLWRGGEWSYTWRDGRSTWFTTDAPPRSLTGRLNVYFGVNPVSRPKPAGERATNDTVSSINCLYGDVDGKDFVSVSSQEVEALLPIANAEGLRSAEDQGRRALREARRRKFHADSAPYMDRALQHIRSLSFQPSVIICSGGGFYPFWLLDQPFLISNDSDRERAKRLQARWVERIGADLAAKDLARILRVPGTHNGKYTPPRPVTFVQADLDRVYRLEELEAWLPQPEPSVPNVAPPCAQQASPKRVSSLGAALARLATAPEGCRNDTLNRTAFLAGQLIERERLDRSDTERQLLAVALQIGLTQQEAEWTIRSGLGAGLRSPRSYRKPLSVSCASNGLRVRFAENSGIAIRTLVVERSSNGATQSS